MMYWLVRRRSKGLEAGCGVFCLPRYGMESDIMFFLYICLRGAGMGWDGMGWVVGKRKYLEMNQGMGRAIIV